jgi:hypothetical protein
MPKGDVWFLRAQGTPRGFDQWTWKPSRAGRRVLSQQYGVNALRGGTISTAVGGMVAVAAGFSVNLLSNTRAPNHADHLF